MKIWEAKIMGQPFSKANRRRAVAGKGGIGIRFIKSEEALNYEKVFRQQAAFIRSTVPGLYEGDVKVSIWIAYKSMVPDLDESLILDLLQGEAYKNDRQVVEKHIYRLPCNKRNPFARILVEDMQ
jgi:Holliday junction resolvase RusA-like endonuclease